MTRILLDARMAFHSGIGTYQRALLPRLLELRPDWNWRILGNVEMLTPLSWSRHQRVEIRPWRAGVYSLSGCSRLPVDAEAGVDLAWFPHFVHPFWLRVPFVATVHDVFHLAMPAMSGSRLMRWAAYWQLRDVGRRARCLMTVSRFSAGEFTRLVGIPRCPTEVIPCAVDPSWSTLDKGDRPHPHAYAVVVGNAKPNKNLVRVMQAFAKVHALPLDLVIVGQRDGFIVGDPALAAAAAALGQRVVFTGRISDDGVQRWVANAAVLVFASLYEGFGLPPLEAMAAGVPVVASRIPALQEVCGEAVEYVDPLDVVDIVRGICSVSDDKRRSALVDNGRKQVSTYSWDTSAKQVASVLDEALEH